jgi:hypothetical protein
MKLLSLLLLILQIQFCSEYLFVKKNDFQIEVNIQGSFDQNYITKKFPYLQKIHDSIGYRDILGKNYFTIEISNHSRNKIVVYSKFKSTLYLRKSNYFFGKNKNPDEYNLINGTPNNYLEPITIDSGQTKSFYTLDFVPPKAKYWEMGFQIYIDSSGILNEKSMVYKLKLDNGNIIE